MIWQKYKYLFAYVLPLCCLLGLLQGGWASGGAFYFAFLVLPLFEQVFPIPEPEAASAEKPYSFFFDVLLYLNLPILYGLLWLFWTKAAQNLWTSPELLLQVLNMGITVGVIGINVAHELGHRKERYHQWMAHILLLPALYQHFFVEHNRGHHKHVATDIDPSSARKGETIYGFWLRSVIGTYISAWQLETERLQKRKIGFWSGQNLMIRFSFMSVLFMVFIFYTFGLESLILCILVAIVAFLMLESVNYIEHYGLRRKQLANGRYEKVLPHHSWNSEHELGRIVLYELTRHSDHHYMESVKYQDLRYHNATPQLPFGYPASILLALVPPIWFGIMDKRLAEFMEENG